MKTKLIIFIFTAFGLAAMALPSMVATAQPTCQQGVPTDTTTFKGHIENQAYQVWLDIDFYKQNIVVPKQEVFGEVAGYLGAIRDTRKWIISDVTIKGNTATLTIINDYGSEDLVATLTHNADGTYTLKQIEGSTIRIVVDNKWVKLPKTMLFK